MQKVIVTGANGFIGTWLLRYMSRKKVQVYAVVKDEKEYIEDIRELPGVRVIYCDLKNCIRLPELIEDRNIDTCIHLAWQGSFGADRADYRLQLKNVEYALALVDVIAEMGVQRFVGAGTLAEKDVLNYHMKDGATPNMTSMYGIAKLCTQLMTKAECTRKGIEHIWCYLSNTYGVGNTTDNFVNMAARKILRGERASFTPGEQLYDFVYISDTVRAIFYAAFRGRKNTAYYLGSGSPRQLKEYIRIIRDAIDLEYPLYLGEVPFNGNSLSWQEYSLEKLTADTGFVSLVSFEEGIQKTVAWLRTVTG